MRWHAAHKGARGPLKGRSCLPVAAASVKPAAHCDAAAALPLHAGAEATCVLAIVLAKDVIDCGRANVNVLSASAQASPAHYATRLGSIELLQALTAQKADLSLQDAAGRTVLHVAVRMACAGRDAALPVMKLLVNSEWGGTCSKGMLGAVCSPCWPWDRCWPDARAVDWAGQKFYRAVDRPSSALLTRVLCVCRWRRCSPARRGPPDAAADRGDVRGWLPGCGAVPAGPAAGRHQCRCAGRQRPKCAAPRHPRNRWGRTPQQGEWRWLLVGLWHIAPPLTPSGPVHSMCTQRAQHTALPSRPACRLLFLTRRTQHLACPPAPPVCLRAHRSCLRLWRLHWRWCAAARLT